MVLPIRFSRKKSSPSEDSFRCFGFPSGLYRLETGAVADMNGEVLLAGVQTAAAHRVDRAYQRKRVAMPASTTEKNRL